MTDSTGLPTTLDLGEMRRKHFLMQGTGPRTGEEGCCDGCREPWPCDACALLDEIDRLRGSGGIGETELREAMDGSYTYEDRDNSVPTLPFVDDGEAFWTPFASKVFAALGAPAPAPLHSEPEPQVSWCRDALCAVEHDRHALRPGCRDWPPALPGDRDAQVARIAAVLPPGNLTRTFGATALEAAQALYDAGLRSTSRDSEDDCECHRRNGERCWPHEHFDKPENEDGAAHRACIAHGHEPLPSRDSEVREAIEALRKPPAHGSGRWALGWNDALDAVLELDTHSSEAAPTPEPGIYTGPNKHITDLFPASEAAPVDPVPDDVLSWWRERRYTVTDLQRAFAEGAEAAPVVGLSGRLMDAAKELREAAISGALPVDALGLEGVIRAGVKAFWPEANARLTQTRTLGEAEGS